MIKVIGIQRLVILGVLVAANVLLAAVIYLYLIPQESKLARDLRVLKSSNQSKSSDIDRMQIEFEQLGEQQDSFERLKQDGFFKAQIRSVAKNILNDIQGESNVVSARTKISAGRIEENEEAKKSKYKLLVSPVVLEIQAYDDSDIYRYLFILEKKYPGHLSVDKILIRRTGDISGPVLRAIATKANPVLVTANVELSWRTMIPESQIIVEEK